MKNIEIKITGSGGAESICRALEEFREILSGLADADIDLGGTVELPTLIMTYGPEEEIDPVVINGVTIEVGLCEEGEHTDRNYLADFYVDTDEVSGSGYIEQNIRSGNPEVIFNGDFTVVNELALYTHFNNSAEEFEEALIGHYNNLVAQARKK